MTRAITITGHAKLMKKLERLSNKNAQRRALRKAINAGTAVLVKAVKAETPVDQGELKRAQDRKIIGRRPTYIRGIVGVNIEKLGTGDDARPVNLDKLVNNGHVNSDGSFTNPNPYLDRAREKAMPAAVDRFTEKLTQEIVREAYR